MIQWYWLFAPLVLSWFAASYFALKGYNVLSYFIKGEQYAASEAQAIAQKAQAIKKAAQ